MIYNTNKFIRCRFHFLNISLHGFQQRQRREFICSLLPQNNGNLPLPFFGGNYPIFLLDNIDQLLYMYINWFIWKIFFDEEILPLFIGNREGVIPIFDSRHAQVYKKSYCKITISSIHYDLSPSQVRPLEERNQFR